MIVNTLNQKIQDAMKVKDEVRLRTLKLLSSELHNYQIDHPEMNEEEELAVIKKEAKKRKDAIESYKKAGALDRANAEEQELKILQEYLPAEMSDEDLKRIVDGVIKDLKIGPDSAKASPGAVGKVIGMVMSKTKGQADGGRVAQMVKDKLA